jgi:hypothetical protein
MRIPHCKILGWSWLLFGGFWSVLVIWAFLMGASVTPEAQPGITYSAKAWWEEVIGNTLECSFFFTSTLLGIGLLRHWRWTQGGLGVLGALLLAIWVLLIVSPSSPPIPRIKSILYLSPLLALALYSLAFVLVPNSQTELSRRSRILIASGSVFGVFAAIGFHLWAFHATPLNPAEARAQWEANMNAFSHLDFERIRPAADAFASDRRAHGLTLPATVSFRQLVTQGYLPLSEAAAFSNADATVFLRAAEVGSTAPWIRIRWKDGGEISVPYVKAAAQ